jgi:hypothetical protein
MQMLKKIALSLAAAGALMIGGALQPAPANAAGGLVVEVHGDGHRWRDRRHRRHDRKRWRHSRRHWQHYPWGCHWERRPRRVRVYDYYYGWYTKTIWRPVHICR